MVGKVKSEIVENNTMPERVSHFQHLGCDITYRFDEEIELNRFEAICNTKEL